MSDATTCPNCGASTKGLAYCGSCGQKAGHSLPTFGEFLHEWMHDAFTLDSKLFQTLRPLLLNPGKLTLEYLGGRRAAYARPLQMYLMASLAFFVLMALNGGVHLRVTDKDNSTGLLEDPAGIEQAAGDSAAAKAAVPLESPSPADTAGAQPDSARGAKLDLPEGLTEMPILGDRFRKQEEKFNTLGGNAFLEESSDQMGQNLPKMIFVLLPVFALILKLLYIRQGRLYLEHMVFGLHFHAFCFVLFAMATVLSLIIFRPIEWITGSSMENVDGIFQVLANIVVCIYLFMAMRRVYQQRRLKTTLKYVLLLLIYNAVLILAMVLTLLVSAMMV